MKVGIAIHVEKDPYESIKKNVEETGLHNGQLLFWDMSLYNEENAEKVKHACREFNFEVTGVWCGWSGKVIWGYPEKYRTVGLVPAETRAQRIEDILKGAWFANEIGVKTLITHPGYMPDNPFDETHIAVVEAFRHICREIKKYGQQFIFETGELLPVTMVQLILEIGEDNVGVNFDPSNITTSGRANAKNALELLIPYVKGFHAKDGVYPKGIAPGGHQVRVVGTGEVEYPAIIKILKDNGYDGALTIEHETASDDRNQDIKDSTAYLESLITSV